MSRGIRGHIRSNVIGYLALFVALSGTAYAVDGPLRGTDRVGSADIIDGEVASVDVANQSLTGTDIANNSVNADDVFGLRGNDDIENGSLTGADIAAETIGSEDVRQEGLRGEDIDEGTLQNFGCKDGLPKAYGWVLGGAGMPTSLTTSSEWIDNTWNCTGNPIAVARLGVGHYLVDLGEDNFAEIGTANSVGGPTSDNDNFVSVLEPGSVNSPADLILRAFDEDGSPEHSWIYFVAH